MKESYEDYRARVLGYLGNRDPLRVMRATPSTLEALVGGVRRPRLTRRTAPDKWSILEIVCHLADTELAMAWRVRNALATPGVDLAWFDEDRWARQLGYNERPVRPQLSLFRALREANLALLRAMPKNRRDTAYAMHQVRGRQSLSQLVRMEAAHDLNHLRQIRTLLGRPTRGARTHKRRPSVQ